MYDEQNKDMPGGSGDPSRQAQDHAYGQYEYRFQSDSGMSGGPDRQQPPHKSGGSFAKTFLTVVLALALALGAGAGGGYLTFRYLSDRASGGDGGVNPAPGNNSIYNSDPEGLLNRSEAEYTPYGSAGENPFAISDVVRMVEDSVVVIRATVVTAGGLWGQTTEGVSSGSGVIIAEEGYILTCNHVVEDARAVEVQLNSGSRYEATLVGSDAASDLAVIKIEPNAEEPLTAAKHGKSGNLVVGEHVVAIGNPLGTLGGTVTDGIISATERQVQTEDGTVMTLIQTNAAINSGNSGGGLFNLKGELIGVVNAKYADAGVEGLAFAIPIDSAYEVECDLIEFGYVRGVIDHGLNFFEVNDTNYKDYKYYFSQFGITLQETGLYVGSSKLNDEIHTFDRIVSVNGQSITTEADFEAAIADCAVGDVLTIEYARYSGSTSTTYTTTITIQEYVPDSVNFS